VPAARHQLAESAKETRGALMQQLREAPIPLRRRRGFLDAAVKRLGVHCTNLSSRCPCFLPSTLGGGRDLDCAERLLPSRNIATPLLTTSSRLMRQQAGALQLRMIQTPGTGSARCPSRHRMRSESCSRSYMGSGTARRCAESVMGLLNETPPRLIRSRSNLRVVAGGLTQLAPRVFGPLAELSC